MKKKTKNQYITEIELKTFWIFLYMSQQLTLYFCKDHQKIELLFDFI